MKFSINSIFSGVVLAIKKRNQDGDIKDFLFTTIGIIVSSFFSYLATRETNIILSPKEFGLFSYSYSLFQLLFVILSLGLYHSYLRFNSQGIIFPLVKFVRNYTIIAVIIFAVIIFYLTKNIFSASFSFILLYFERTYYFRSLKLIKELNALLILTSLLNYIIIKIYSFTVSVPLSSNIIQIYGVCYFISVFFLLYKPKISTNVLSVKKTDVIKYSVPLIGITLIEWLLNFCNQLIVKEYLGLQDLASYSMAFRALFIFRFISSVFLMFYPTIYFRDIPFKKMSNIFFFRNLIISILLICTVIMLIFPKIIYTIMGGSKYIGTSYLFLILLVGDFLRISASFYGLIFTYQIKTYLNLGIQFIASLINVVVCFLLIKKIGLISASISNFSACLFIFLMTIVIARKMEKDYAIQ